MKNIFQLSLPTVETSFLKRASKVCRAPAHSHTLSLFLTSVNKLSVDVLCCTDLYAGNIRFLFAKGEECVFNHRIVSVKAPETVLLLFQGFSEQTLALLFFFFFELFATLYEPCLLPPRFVDSDMESEAWLCIRLSH